MMSFSKTAGGLLGNFGPQPSYSFRSCQEAIMRRLKGKGAKRGKVCREAPLRNERKRSMEPIAVKDLMLTITSLLEVGIQAMVTFL